MPLTIHLVCILPCLQLCSGVQSASLVHGCRSTSRRETSTQKYLKRPEPAMVGDIQTRDGISHISWQLADGRAQMSWPGILGRTFTMIFCKPDVYKHALEKQVGLSSQNSCSWETYHGNVHESTDLCFIHDQVDPTTRFGPVPTCKLQGYYMGLRGPEKYPLANACLNFVIW